MKSKSIRQRMFKIIGEIIIAVLFFQLLSTYCNFHMIHRLNETLELQFYYNSYQTRLDLLQESVAVYFNQTIRKSEEEIEELCQEFEQYTADLAGLFSHPQFTDNLYIAQVYLEAVQNFLEHYPDEAEEIQLSYYNETVRLYRILSESYQTTSPFEQELILQWIHTCISDWRIKEIASLLLGILICLITFWNGKRFVDYLSAPIIALTEKAHQIIRENYEKVPENTNWKVTCMETVMLTEAFNQMVGTIKAQMEELKEKIEISQKLHHLELENIETKMTLYRTETCLMQSLLSPHFLFNCLTTLSSLAFIEEAHQTEEYSIRLAKFFRQLLNRIGQMITVEEEVEHLEQYIEIQKMRFQKRIAFAVECDENCKNKKIPAIILQPLIENALVHGLKNCRQGGMIQVRICREEKELVMRVSDNGEGIEEEKIRQIEINLKKPFETGERGIGLKSVAYRLNYFFNSQGILSLQSRDHWTTVTISVPVLCDLITCPKRN